MDLELKLNGQVVVKATVDLGELLAALQASVSPSAMDAVANNETPFGAPLPKSVPLTKADAEKLLRQIHPKSAAFLRQIVANGGSITWGEMRKIFGIDDPTDWGAFSGSYGKGITRTLRYILNVPAARLVWWDDDDESWGDFDNGQGDGGKVYIDGPALDALREASGFSS